MLKNNSFQLNKFYTIERNKKSSTVDCDFLKLILFVKGSHSG